MTRRLPALAVALVVLSCGAATARAELSVIGCVGQRPEAPPVCAPGSGLLSPRALAVAGDASMIFAAGTSSSAVAALRRAPGGALAFAGCVSDDGTDGVFGQDGTCRDGDGLGAPGSLAVRPDGRYLYAAGQSGDTVAYLTPDLAPAGCLADRGGGRCTDAVAMGSPSDVAVSPDGRNLYVAAGRSDGVLAFAVDTSSGGLSEIGCVSDNGTDGVCADGEALRGPEAVVVSPDGAHVYTAARGSDAIAIFGRDSSSGALHQLGCVLNDAPVGPCTSAIGLRFVDDLAFSPDGSRLYATAAIGAVTAFARDPASGALRQLACLSSDEEPERGCTRGDALDGAAGLAVAADGTLIVAAEDASTVVELAADPATGALSRRSCLSAFDQTGCAHASVLQAPADVVVAPDGRVYVAAVEANAVAALAPAPTIAAPSASVRAARASVRVRCPAAAPRACSGRVILEGRRRPHPTVIGAATFSVPRGTARRVRVRLRGAAGRSARRQRVLASLHGPLTQGRRSWLILGPRKHP